MSYGTVIEREADKFRKPVGSYRLRTDRTLRDAVHNAGNPDISHPEFRLFFVKASLQGRQFIRRHLRGTSMTKSIDQVRFRAPVRVNGTLSAAGPLWHHLRFTLRLFEVTHALSQICN